MSTSGWYVTLGSRFGGRPNCNSVGVKVCGSTGLPIVPPASASGEKAAASSGSIVGLVFGAPVGGNVGSANAPMLPPAAPEAGVTVAAVDLSADGL